jgi:NAD(P)-dependent dehydrogenase (short-subunit alcohol dehydrogenase family)
MSTNSFPPQHQNVHPGKEAAMHPSPVYHNPNYRASDKLLGKVAVISGGDSGIGRAVAITYAKEGADVAIIYLNEHGDAKKTADIVSSLGRKCLLIPADLQIEKEVATAIARVNKEFGRIDVLVNNAAVQYPQNSILDISGDQLLKTFQTNIFGMFYLTKEVLPLMQSGSTIINTTSVAGFKGSADLIDYSATKGAITSFTYSLALSLTKQNIRVNAVSPGPVWTPLIVSSFDSDKVSHFGENYPMQRAAEPCELAPAYVFLACEDSSNMSGQVLHINSGEIV